jgi:hypothetical protein
LPTLTLVVRLAWYQCRIATFSGFAGGGAPFLASVSGTLARWARPGRSPTTATIISTKEIPANRRFVVLTPWGHYPTKKMNADEWKETLQAASARREEGAGESCRMARFCSTSCAVSSEKMMNDV